jgi:enoyl-CoA hydratase/carnithine racemase
LASSVGERGSDVTAKATFWRKFRLVFLIDFPQKGLPSDTDFTVQWIAFFPVKVESMSDQITLSRNKGVLEILLSRPEKKNALTNAMYRTITEAMREAQKDPAIHVVLFGSNHDIFSAGNDMSDFAEYASGTSTSLEAHAFIEELVLSEKPIVAGVPGLAVGVGTTLLLHCDWVVVAKTARLSAPFVDLALVPEAASSLLLPARIGYLRAFAVFAMGQSITGEEAVMLGLANESHERARVMDSAREAAYQLAKKPLQALIATKRLMRDPEVLMNRLRQENLVFAERLRSAEARAIFANFLDGRSTHNVK